MEVARRNKLIAEHYLSHEETLLTALVSQNDIPLTILQHAKKEYVELIEKWERYQHGVEVLLDPESLADEIAEGLSIQKAYLRCTSYF